MLMDIKCSAVASIKVHLVFDDGAIKDRVVGTGDLIEVEYNGNGIIHKVNGKVLSVSVVGTDPKGWSIIVDASDDFKSDRVRICPMNILDLEIIRKADQLEFVQTPIGHEGVPYIRIHRGRLQYSMDGYRWKNIIIDKKDVILPAEGTAPYDEGDIDDDCYPPHHHHSGYNCHCEPDNSDDFNSDDEDDTIEDSSY